MKKFVLHKPSSSIYLFTKENDSDGVYLEGIGRFNPQSCEEINPRNSFEEFLFNLIWLYQSNIRNKRLWYKFKNIFI